MIPKESLYDRDTEMSFLLKDGDWHLDTPLDLDAEMFSDIIAIIVTGSMTATQIYNAETDSSCGLVVLGDLTAQNIVVGGQEIFVNQNLTIHELFWGDYNHGSLGVKGEINTKVFIATDYDYPSERFGNQDGVNVRFHICDEKDEIDDDYTKDEGELIQRLFEQKYIYTPDDRVYSWGDWLDKDKIFKALSQNKSVLLSDEVISKNFEVGSKTWLFLNFDISEENLKIMVNANYFDLVKTLHEFDEINPSYTVIEDNYNFFRIVDEIDFVEFTVRDVERDCSFIFSMIDDGSENYAVWIEKGLDSGELQDINETSHPEEYAIFKNHWKHWLKLYSKIIKERQKFLKAVNIEKMQTISRFLQDENCQKMKKTDKKTGEIYFEVENEDEYVLYKIYPATENFAGSIVALSTMSNEEDKYTYQYDTELQRFKLIINDDFEPVFDWFSYYSNAIFFFNVCFDSVERMYLHGF
ncbi:MAG: hypothetical protein Q4C98_10770 [Capnocytophaga sp.]|nr:hypothetical protein [Capnocytophaga sp.]